VPPRSNDTRILVVDDDSAIRETIATVLEDEGYRIETASDGAQALALLNRGVRADLILLDLMMPVMNGWEFRAQQLAVPGLAAIPVIAMTASARVDQHRSADFDHWALKPFDLEPLLKAVTSLARRPNVRGDVA
jgi:CheY-like chemotaxis protein